MRGARQGVVVAESRDTGPFPLVQVLADGKRHDVTILNMTGLTGSPLKDSAVLIVPVEGQDDILYGIIAGPPTSGRVDRLKPGETTLKNHKTGSMVTMKDNGDIVVDCKNDERVTVNGSSVVVAKTLIRLDAPTIEIEGFVKIKGDIVQQGGITSTGVHKAAGHT